MTTDPAPDARPTPPTEDDIGTVVAARFWANRLAAILDEDGRFHGNGDLAALERTARELVAQIDVLCARMGLEVTDES
jgi:hypothetical protein